MTMRMMFDDPGASVPDAPWDLAAGAAPDAFREAMRRVVGGVAVVATLREGRPWGMTVSAFAPVCMEPPTLLVCVNAATATAADIAGLHGAADAPGVRQRGDCDRGGHRTRPKVLAQFAKREPARRLPTLRSGRRFEISR